MPSYSKFQDNIRLVCLVTLTFFLLLSFIISCSEDHSAEQPASSIVVTNQSGEDIVEEDHVPFSPPFVDLFDLRRVEIPPTMTPNPLPTQTATPKSPGDNQSNTRPTSPAPTATFPAYGITQTIGTSYQGLPIVAHRFGFGTHQIVIVGGIHGGYEWNTILLSYQLIDYFEENNDQIPNDITLIIIPSANPDGQFLTTQTQGRFGTRAVADNTQPGRFNGNGVDLNRNWDCEWESVGYWGERIVDTGTRPFSEPESSQLSRYLAGQRVDAVVFLHSAANGIFLGGCPEPLLETAVIANVYSDASTYPLFQNFSSYPVTGDASDWLATQNIPSFSVELRNHGDIEFAENLAGVKAIIEYFHQK